MQQERDNNYLLLIAQFDDSRNEKDTNFQVPS
jgi:hypothetical protein